MSTTFKTIIDDMKSSLHLAWGRALSYFLANLGMVIVVAILAALIALPILSVVLLALWPFNEATMTAMTQWATANPLGAAALIGVIAIPFVSLFMVVSGSIYGMSYDLVAKGDTKAETAFSYLRHKFLTFFATGVMMTLIVILPPALAWELAAYVMNVNIGPYVGALLAALTFVWVFFTAGLTSMVFPAVVSGKGVQAAFKESFTLARSHFDRIFGVLSAIVLLLAVTFGPIVVLGLAMPFMSVPISIALIPAIAAAALWTVVSAFLWLLLFLPMVRIVWVKVYQELTGGNIATQSVVDMPIV
jgi:hypothetical protein